MLRKKDILLTILIFLTCGVFAQKAERTYIRKGNRAYEEKSFTKSEINFRKAIDNNHKSSIALYNLGNALSQEKKFNDAMKSYQSAAKIEKNKLKLAHIYHNIGVLLLANKDYENAIKACELSLVNNPSDEETRYNLALAKKLLKKNPKNKDKNKNNNKDKDKNKNNQDKKDNQNKNNNQNKEKQQQQKSQNQMSKQNAEQLLNAAMQQEQSTQDKMRNKQSLKGSQLEKNW